MGCGYEFGCKTCRKGYDLGYGPYSTWLTAHTLKEFDESLAGSLKDIPKNQRIRACLEEHDGHDTFYASEDFAHRHGKVLCMEWGYMGSECQVLAEDWGDWEYVGCPD